MKTMVMSYLLSLALLVFAGNASAFTEGSSNNYFGTYAGGAAGSYNSFFGGYAGTSNYGSYNTFNGYMAGFANTSGSYNTFSGYMAGYSNDEGYSNTFSGYRAGSRNESGSWNTFYGYRSGHDNTTGYDNTFIGFEAGREHETGYLNTFIGFQAGLYNRTGHNNIFVGNQAGEGNGTGHWNTFIGSYAGSNNTGSQNTFLGASAGLNNTGSDNVFLGSSSGYNETGSNKLYIENSSSSSPLIYGEFDNDIVVINGDLTADSVSGDGSGLTNITASNADTVDGFHASSFATASHSHSGADITSGTVADSRIDATIARDAELSAHTSRVDNPHSVTAAQVGAADASHDHDADYINANSNDTMNGDLLINGILDVDEDLYVVGNIYAESDQRSKKDIKPIDSSLSKIKNIRGVSYTWKNEEKSAEGAHYGVIAQEMEKVLPEIVTTGSNGRKKVAYIELVPVLIEAVKEQQKIINVQKELNNQQQNAISHLLGEVKEIKKQMKLINNVAMADMN